MKSNLDLTSAELKRLTSLAPTKAVHDAAHQYIRLKRRQEHPAGRFDNAGRFYPKCQYACCNVRPPSRAFPNSLMKHARSLEHVAHAHGIPDRVLDIRRYANLAVEHPELFASHSAVIATIAADAAATALSEIRKADKQAKGRLQCTKNALTELA